MHGKPWVREDVIIAYALYCVIPFAKINNSNKTIKDAAEIMQRSPASLKMKMCNLANLDPAFRATGRMGLAGGITKLDKAVFEEFNADWSALSGQAEILLGIDIFDIETPVYNGPDKRQKKHFSEINEKQARRFFRKAVLATYNSTCCISGVTNPTLLNASHIKPWEVSDVKTERANPANGLCLNAFYDKAFDQGIITVDTKYKIWVSPKVKDIYSDEFTMTWLYALDGKTIVCPRRFRPQKDLLEYHNDVIYLR